MQLKRAGSQPSTRGPAEWFTGTVRIDPLHSAAEPSRVSHASVTFEPGARTNWHTHPLGQTLIVTSGCGWTQCDGESVVEIRAGDVIWCPPNHRHWHGASPTTAMTHIAIQEALNGKVVEWMEKVTDENTKRQRHERGHRGKDYAIPAYSFAHAVAFAMSQPDDVDINEIQYRPTRQLL